MKEKSTLEKVREIYEESSLMEILESLETILQVEDSSEASLCSWQIRKAMAQIQNIYQKHPNNL